MYFSGVDCVRWYLVAFRR